MISNFGITRTTSKQIIEIWIFLSKFYSSFEDIGLYDYSAVFKYISNATNRNDLIFIGHSMATTASLIYASLKPEEANQHVQIFIELSPVAYLSHMTSQLGNINTTIPKLKVEHI